jgi:hypothetical protein
MLSPSVFDSLRMVIMRPVAPWILRILLYYEKTAPQLSGFTEQEIIGAISRKFRERLKKDPPHEEQIKADLVWLEERQLIKAEEGMIKLSTGRGREIAVELTPAVTNV